MDLLTKEEIEKAGFIYEPDETKCKTRKIRLHVDCNYYKDGKWTSRSTPEFTPEWKEACAQRLREDAYYLSHINKVFIPEIEPMSGEGVMCRWAMISGYGTPLAKRWIETGLLEGLLPKQFPEASEYLNQVTLELIARSPKQDRPKEEHQRAETIAGMVIPLARTLFEKYPNRPDAKVLVEDFSKYFDEKRELFDALAEGIAQDQEQEFMSLYQYEMKSRGLL